ncbi:MAG: hypothetical protein ACSLE1_15890 [Sphingobium sp.]
MNTTTTTADIIFDGFDYLGLMDDFIARLDGDEPDIEEIMVGRIDDILVIHRYTEVTMDWVSPYEFPGSEFVIIAPTFEVKMAHHQIERHSSHRQIGGTGSVEDFAAFLVDKRPIVMTEADDEEAGDFEEMAEDVRGSCCGYEWPRD